jgi:hypothetical protein
MVQLKEVSKKVFRVVEIILKRDFFDKIVFKKVENSNF